MRTTEPEIAAKETQGGKITEVTEVEITMSLLNNKLNYIITQLAEIKKE